MTALLVASESPSDASHWRAVAAEPPTAAPPQAPHMIATVIFVGCAVGVALGLYQSCEDVGSLEVCYTRDWGCWASVNFANPGTWVMQASGQLTLIGCLLLGMMILAIPWMYPVILAIAPALAPTLFILLLPALPIHHVDLQNCGFRSDRNGSFSGIVAMLSNGQAMGMFALLCYPMLIMLILQVDAERERHGPCRIAAFAGVFLFWLWLLTSGISEQHHETAEDAVFLLLVGTMATYTRLKTQLHPSCLPYTLFPSIGFATSGVCLLSYHLAVHMLLLTPRHFVRWYLQCLGCIALAWLPVLCSFHQEDPSPQSPLPHFYAGMPESPLGAQRIDAEHGALWNSVLDGASAVLPSAYMYALPWLTHTGFAPWPPPMPVDYPKEIEVSKSSLSGFVESPQSMAGCAASWFPVFVGLWRLRGRCLTEEGGAWAGSLLHQEYKWTSAFLIYFQLFFGLFLVAVYSWQPLPHIVFSSAFIVSSYVFQLLAMASDASLCRGGWMRAMLVVQVLFGIPAVVIGNVYGEDARLPDYLLVPYPFSPTDDNLFFLCEVTGLAALSLVASPLMRSLQKHGSGRA